MKAAKAAPLRKPGKAGGRGQAGVMSRPGQGTDARDVIADKAKFVQPLIDIMKLSKVLRKDNPKASSDE